MLSLFQPANNPKPIAKAAHAFSESSSAKWVPINKSFITLTKIILRAAVARLKVEHVAITLRCITYQGYRHIVLANNENDLHLTAFGAVEEFIISTGMLQNGLQGLTSTASIAMDYQQQRLGYVMAQLYDPASLMQTERQAKQVTDDLAQVASDIVSIIQRYETRYRAIFIYGDNSYWVGNSAALCKVGHDTHQLAHAIQPVLIRGNKGVGKAIAARTLHCLRHADVLPFIESSCEDWKEGAATSILQSLYTCAKGGTLFLRNLDKLSNENFCLLQGFWKTKVSELAERGFDDSVGMVFTVSKVNFVGAPALASWFACSVIELYLPDLVERRDDVRDLARFFMREYKLSVEFDFTEEAWRMLEEFSWKENVNHLKNVIQQVALRAETPLFSAAALQPLLF